jgi:hypothetical protein
MKTPNFIDVVDLEVTDKNGEIKQSQSISFCR